MLSLSHSPSWAQLAPLLPCIFPLHAGISAFLFFRGDIQPLGVQTLPWHVFGSQQKPRSLLQGADNNQDSPTCEHTGFELVSRLVAVQIWQQVFQVIRLIRTLPSSLSHLGLFHSLSWATVRLLSTVYYCVSVVLKKKWGQNTNT